MASRNPCEDQFCYPDPVPDTLTEKELRRWLDFVDLGHLADYPGHANSDFERWSCKLLNLIHCIREVGD